MLVLGPHGKDREYLRHKTNIGNPKVNRGCPSLTASHILADWMEISLVPSIKHTPLGGLPYWGFQRYVMFASDAPCTTSLSGKIVLSPNKANLRNLIAATGLVISNWIQIVNFSARVTVKFDG